MSDQRPRPLAGLSSSSRARLTYRRIVRRSRCLLCGMMTSSLTPALKACVTMLARSECGVIGSSAVPSIPTPYLLSPPAQDLAHPIGM